MVADNTMLKSAAKSTLNGIAKHAASLAIGLQNAAPPAVGNSPNKSVLYLTEIANELTKISSSIDAQLTREE